MTARLPSARRDATAAPVPSQLTPQIRSAFVVQVSLTLQESSSNTHDILAIRPDLKVSVLHSHRSDCRQKLRTLVGLLTPKQSERATARPSESRILIADACTLSPRHNAVVTLSLTFKPRVCKDVVWQNIAHDEQWLRTYSSVGPGNCLGVLKEDSTPQWPSPSDLDCLVLVLHDEESPTAGTTKACGLRLQVLHRTTSTSVSRLCGNHTAFFCPGATAEKLTEVVLLFWWLLGAVQRFDGGQRVSACCDASHVPTPGSCFLPSSLSDFTKPPAFQSIQQFQVWSCLPCEECPGALQCQPIQSRMLCVTATGPSRIAPPFA